MEREEARLRLREAQRVVTDADNGVTAARDAMADAEANREAAQRVRNRQMLKANDAGLSMREIANLVGLSHSKVHRLLQQARAESRAGLRIVHRGA